MRTWPVGTKVFVCGNSNGHSYVRGKAYIVAEIDDDGTLRARDPETGNIGNFLRWQDVSITPPIGWEFCKTVLPPDVVRFLEAFDGIDSLILREEVKDRLLQRLPDLYGAILEETSEDRAEHVPLASLPDPRVSGRPSSPESSVTGWLRGLDAYDDDEIS